MEIAQPRDMKRPQPRDFECPDCHAQAGKPCRSSRGNTLPTEHTRRLYKAQDAWAKAAREDGAS